MDFDLAIIAGEPSGDEHSAALLKELALKDPNLKIAAVCGPKMHSAYNLYEILHIDQLSVMGFVDVIKNSLSLYRNYRLILNFLSKHKVKKVIFVDYPGLNLQLMKKLRHRGYQGIIWHYIAPTAWAWKKNRVLSLKQYCDHLFCILPFETSFFQSHGVKSSYVGHPLVTKISSKKFEVEKNKNLVSIFPGSRIHELTKNLPIILKSCMEFLKQYPQTEFAISAAKDAYKELIKKELNKIQFPQSVKLFDQSQTQKMMATSQLTIAKSGTCNLEIALHKSALIVVYAVTKLDQFIAQKIFKIRLPFYSLPNLIMQKKIIPEFYGSHFTSDNLLEAMKSQFQDLNKTASSLHELETHLGSFNPGKTLASKILDVE